MLDTDTKRRIDTARDILVGKVPDPKSQVEQITIALIYKFMDDMDAESEELGGHRKFFAGEFARYGWAKLMRSGLGGHEILNLYAEAIAKMPENPGIPPLFRDIFNIAFLPYRDPETLRAFLKVIVLNASAMPLSICFPYSARRAMPDNSELRAVSSTLL
jgi:type I restriction enzyme M protein